MRELFRKLQSVAALALGSVPAALVLFAYTQPSLLPWTWVCSGAYFLFAVLGICIPGKWRLVYGILVAAAVLAAPVLLVTGKTLLLFLAAELFYLILFAWSLTIGGWQAGRELPGLLRAVCFGFHLAAQVVVFADKLSAQPVLTAHVPGLLFAFLAFVFLTVLALNRVSMNKASTVNQQVSIRMRHKNTVMTLVLFALGILAAFIPYIYDWLKALMLWLATLLLRLLTMQPSDSSSGGAVVPESGSDSALPMEEAAQGPLAQLLEIVMLVIGILLVIAVTVFWIYWIGRRLKGLTRRLWAALEQYAAAVSEDYQEEITDTRRDASGTRIARERRSPIRHSGQKGSMNPAEAIRYRYRRLLRKHPEWTASTTARENLPAGFAELYEQARYSGHPVTEADAERFTGGTKRL